MGETRRITPRMALDAYRETGLRPVREALLERGPKGEGGTPTGDEECGCALGALYLARLATPDFDTEALWLNGDDMKESIAYAASELGLDERYAAGFAAGFDSDRPIRSGSKEFTLGHADGVAAARAVFAEGGAP